MRKTTFLLLYFLFLPCEVALAQEYTYKDLRRLAVEAARQKGVDSLLFLAIIRQESDWNIRAYSSAGAEGLGQLMPATQDEHGVDSAYRPEENLRGAAEHVRHLLDTFGGNYELTVAAYNAGEEAVHRAGDRIPRISETREYVRSVRRRYYARDFEPSVNVTYRYEPARRAENRLADHRLPPPKGIACSASGSCTNLPIVGHP